MKSLVIMKKANAFYMMALRQSRTLTPEELQEAQKWLAEANKKMSGKADMNS